jgi:hypothetical protein
MILDIKSQLDPLLKKLSEEKSLDVAEDITSIILGLLNVKTESRFLANIPRIDAELSRFEIAPEFARQAAAFRIPNDKIEIIEPHLFWIKKATKTNLSWLIGVTPNFEDSEANDYKSIGIDFVVPPGCDSLIVLLSNKYKIRSLELKDRLTQTQLEIFTQWSEIKTEQTDDLIGLKKEIHSKLWESFNFEPTNRKFYLELVEHFSLLVQHLEKSFERKPAVMFTTRLIGRILFIWFLRKKNLINKGMEYFTVEDPLNQTEYYRNKLEALFFETLNRDIKDRENGDGLTPYLNGGLFDISETDFYDDKNLTIPNGYFNQLFETLNKYNFTVDESSPEFQQVAIDPEMLGRIFESLLAEQIEESSNTNKRKANGGFYTPREIVSYMCEQTIIEYLKSKVKEDAERDRRIEELITLPEAIFRDQDQNKRRDWKPYSQSILQALGGGEGGSPIQILDPAVGSGAFPMGMLHLLVKIYTRLDVKYEKNISKLKRDILANSLYGVDIEQTAIEICRLRAWLSIIVDVHEGDEVEPLPNLDFKFVCANSLIPLDNSDQASLFVDYSLKDKLISIRNEYFSTSSKAKKTKLQKNYLELTAMEELFDDLRTRQLKSYEPFNLSHSASFYDPEIFHGVNEFDVVIGNPPYLIVYDDSQKKVLESLYDEFKQNNNLYVAFIIKAYGLLKPNGLFSFITPNTFIIGSYFKKLRSFLSSNTQLNEIIDFGKIQLFEDANVFCSITSFQKIPPEHPWRLKNSLTNVVGSIQPKSSEFIFKSSLIDKLDKLDRLEKFFEIKDVGFNYWTEGRGKVRGNSIGSRVFYKGERVEPDDIPYIKGTNITKYSITEPVNFLKHNWKDFLTKDDTFRFSEAYFNKNEKLVYRQTSDQLICSLDVNQYSTDKTVHIIVPKPGVSFSLKYLLGLMNSKLFNYFFRWYKQEEGKTFAQVKTVDVKALPFVYSNQNEVIVLVDSLLGLTNKHSVESANLQAEIDKLVYKIFNLTDDEINEVELFGVSTK